MPYSYDQETLDALDRLDTFYNGNDYDAATNPGGFGHGGHRINFIPSLRDVATVGDSVADAASTAQTAADQASNYATALFATSTTGQTVGTGSKTFATQTGKNFIVGAHVLVASSASPSNYMHGQITAYAAGSLTVDVTLTQGSGTFNSWNISLSAPRGPTGSTGATGAAGLAGLRFKWSSSTAVSDPTSGYIKINSGSAASATTLSVSETDVNLANISGLLSLWDDSSSIIKGYLLIVDSVDLTKFLTFVVTGTMTDNGTWDTFNISGGAGTPPSNDDIVAVQLVPKGDKGDQGIQGVVGNAGGGITINYLFSNSTADNDPGNGNLRLNSGTQNLTTVIRADLLDVNGTDFTAALDFMDDSTTTANRGQIRIYKTADPTAFIIFSSTTVATPSGYRNITVSVLTASSANPFANNDPISLAFTRTGDAGGGSASAITFSPAGNIAATDVQAAIQELDTEKLSGNDAQLSGTTNVTQAIRWSGDISPTALSAATHDWNPAGLTTATVIRIDVSGAVQDLTGLTGGADGRMILLYNISSSFAVVLRNQNTGSAAANRFALGGDFSLQPNGSLLLHYDATRLVWVPVSSMWGSVLRVGAGGNALVTSSTASTSTSSGALVVTGGVGVGGAVYTGSEVVSGSFVQALAGSGFKLGSGITALLNSTNYTILRDPANRDAIALGNATDPANYYYNDNHNFVNRAANTNLARIDSTGIFALRTTASSSSTTGALVVSGGVGVAGIINAGGDINAAGFITSGNFVRAATSGGFQLGTYTAMFQNGNYTEFRAPDNVRSALFGNSTTPQNLFYNGTHNFINRAQTVTFVSIDSSTLHVYMTTAATGSFNGALVVDGGVSIAGTLWVGAVRSGHIYPVSDGTYTLGIGPPSAIRWSQIHSYETWTYSVMYMNGSGGNTSPQYWYQQGSGSHFQTYVGFSPSRIYIDNFNSQGVYMDWGSSFWSALSDVSMKQNIQNISVLDKIGGFRCVSFERKDQSSAKDPTAKIAKLDISKRREIGAIAQEVKTLFPEVVSGGDGDMGIAYSALAPIALQGVKELNELVIALTRRIEQLENRT